MKYIFSGILATIVSIIIFSGVVQARWSCEIDPSEPAPPPPATQLKRCIDKGVHGAYETLKDCLTGGSPQTDLLDCKDDPRYQLRNFAPFLNFPNIGSMLNLGTALITVLGSLLCGVFMFSGAFNYLNAGGDAKKLESARSRIVYALIGLLVVLFAYTIVKLILDTTSTNTVGF